LQMAGNELRYKRLRLLTKKLNRERKRQAKKIDILCNDFITAQKDFVRKLNAVNFMAVFYESIIGKNDLNSLLRTAVRMIKDELGDATVTFFLREGENFEVHIFETADPISVGKGSLEDCFSPELMDNICKANKVCTLEELFALGLEGNPVELNKVSAVTIPLGRAGYSLGFILIYRSGGERVSLERLGGVRAVAPGFTRAIRSCRGPAQPA